MVHPNVWKAWGKTAQFSHVLGKQVILPASRCFAGGGCRERVDFLESSLGDNAEKHSKVGRKWVASDLNGVVSKQRTPSYGIDLRFLLVSLQTHPKRIPAKGDTPTCGRYDMYSVLYSEFPGSHGMRFPLRKRLGRAEETRTGQG